MSLIFILIKFISILVGSIFAGFIGSLTGLGGGTVLVPILTLFYGIPLFLQPVQALYQQLQHLQVQQAHTQERKLQILRLELVWK